MPELTRRDVLVGLSAVPTLTLGGRACASLPVRMLEERLGSGMAGIVQACPHLVPAGQFAISPEARADLSRFMDADISEAVIRLAGVHDADVIRAILLHGPSPLFTGHSVLVHPRQSAAVQRLQKRPLVS